MAMLASIVFFAVSADGRAGTESTTNDGGAWLVNRRTGAIGHVNRSVQELSAAVKVSQAGAQFDVFQPEGVIVAHDLTSDSVEVVDERTHLIVNSLSLPPGAEVRQYASGVVVVAQGPFRVWRLDASALAELQTLDSLEPLFQASAPHAWSVSFGGDVAVDDQALGQLVVYRLDATIDRWSHGEAVDEVLFDGDRPIVVIGDRLGRVDGGKLTIADDRLGPWSVVQAPAPDPLGSVVVITDGGRIHRIDGRTGSTSLVGQLAGTGFGAPIVHEGCVHAVTSVPATFWVQCGTSEAQVTELVASPGAQLRLRLVHGAIWINDLSTNSLWLVDDELEVSRIDDWGAVLPQDDGEDSELSSARTDDDIVEDVENPDAEDADTVDADEFDEDGINQPPVAFDDNDVQTHLGRPVLINVVDNDEDPDNDVLLVASVENLSGTDAIVRATIDGTSIQVTPAADFEGVIEYRYTISDGRGGTDSANGSVTVRSRSGAENRPPVAVTDIGSVTAGGTLRINVIGNDFDPDGDSLVLVAASAPEGTIAFDPSGQVIYEPAAVTGDGEVELSYTIADDFGELAEGRIRATIRLRDSNQPPDARNDGGVTVVGQPVTIRLLLNDTDPDGDDLFVAQRPELVSPINVEVFTTITPDGEFVFIPEQAGTYVFRYGASDQEETDLAQIRVEVTEVVGNRPPLAVRDDVVIPAGESRFVYSLVNDGDPDGDVIGIVDFNVTPGSGLIVERFSDQGFRVFAEEAGPPRRTFRYSISDGESEPVETTVVVAVADPLSINQPPIAQADVVEIRPGTTTTVGVLGNDFDPEGGPLRVVAVSTVDGVTTQIGSDNQFVRIGVDSTTTTSFNLTYEIVDDQQNRTASVIRVQIVADGQPNRPPVARPDSTRTPFGQVLAIPAIANDSDPDGDAIRVESVTRQPVNGRVELDELTGEIIYTPAPQFSGTDRFSYSIVDAFGARAEGEVLVGVMPEPAVNRDPIALPDSYITIATGTALEMAVLINDSDPDGDQLRISDVQAPEVGTVSRSLDGRRLTFTAPIEQDEDRTIVFDYTVSDGAGGFADAAITMIVQATPGQLPNAPVAVDDDAGTHATGDEVRVAVLSNDRDPDTPLSSLAVSAFDPEVSVDGQMLVFIAGAASTEYTYQVTDPEGNQDTGIVTVSIVNPIPPVAIDDSWGPEARGTIVEIPVLLNDYDIDGEPEDLELVAVTGDGAQVSGQTIRITVPAESTQYGYTIRDANGLEASASISLIVTDNQAPLVAPQTIQTPFEESVRIDLSTAGTDPDGDPLFYSCCQSASNGSPVVLDAGQGLLSIEFTPDDGFDGDASFSFEVDDQVGNVVAGSVTVQVGEQPNRPPTVVDGALSIQVPRPDGPQVSETLDLGAVTDDPDLDDELTWSIESQPGQNLSASISGSVLEVSATDDSQPGSTTLAWRVTDPEGESASGTIVITVERPTNSPPVTADVTVNVAAGSSVDVGDIALATSDTDDNEVLTYEIGSVANPQITATLTGTTTVTVAAAVTATRSEETTSFTVTDRLGETSTSSFTIVVGEPDASPPTAGPDDADTVQGVAVVIPVLDNDTDPIGAGLTIVDPGSSPDGAATVAGSAISFAPSPGFFGEAQFAYTIRDAADIADREASGTVTVTVTGRPDAPSAPVCVPSSTQVDLTWTAPNGNGDAAGDYRVEHDRGDPAEPAGNSTSYQWTDLSNNTDYRFRVYASNVAGESLPSAWSDVCTPDTEPERPAAPTVVHGDRVLTVSWQEPDNNGSPITGYQLRIGGGEAIPVAGTSTDWEPLENGQDYTFEVAAVNAAGESVFSLASAPEHPSTTPAIPAIGTTTRGGLIGASASTFLEMNWTSVPVSQDGGDDIDYYRVQLRPQGGSAGSPIVVPGANSNSYLWSGLANGTPHQFRVRAHNRDGESNWSPWSAPLQACTVPQPPNITSVVPGDKVADVTFTEPGDNGGCSVTQYNVRVAGSPDLGTSVTSPGTVPKPGLTNGQPYAFEVRASNVIGDSGWVTSASVTPLGAPICPNTLQVSEIDRTSQTITWDPANFNGGSTNSYEYQVLGGGSGPTSSATSHTLSLAPNQGHTISVVAINEAGSDVCGSRTFTSCPDTPLQPPKPGISVLPNGQMLIDFDHPPIPCVSQPQVTGDLTIAYSQAESTSGPSLPDAAGDISAIDLSNGPGFAPDTTERGRVRGCFSDDICGPWSPWSDYATVPNPQSISISFGDSFPTPCALNTGWAAEGPCIAINVSTSGFSPSYFTKCFAADVNGIWTEWSSVGSYLTTSTYISNACTYGGAGGAVIVLGRNTGFELGIFAGQPVSNFTVPAGYVASNVLTWPTS